MLNTIPSALDLAGMNKDILAFRLRCRDLACHAAEIRNVYSWHMASRRMPLDSMWSHVQSCPQCLGRFEVSQRIPRFKSLRE
jgi:hypothetical protein